MALIAATDRRDQHDRYDADPVREPTERRRIDVTDLHAAGIEEYVQSNVETDAVSLEHRGARTFLVLEE